MRFHRHDTNSPGIRAVALSLVLAAVALAGASSIAMAADCGGMPAPSIDWQQCDKSSLVLSGADFSGANLMEADFSSTDLRDANLTGANVEKVKLIRTSLAGAQADKANFSRVEAYRTSFAGIQADGAKFASAELQRADFADAKLTGADFQKAELGRANFAGATITGSKFTLANLSRATLHGTVYEGPIDFKGAFLFLTRLEGLDLTAATGLTQPQLDLACGDADTKLPEGLKPGPTWPCKFD